MTPERFMQSLWGFTLVVNKVDKIAQKQVGKSQGQVPNLQVLGFWGLTFLRTYDPIKHYL